MNPSAFFEQVYLRLLEHEQKQPLLKRYYRIAGKLICLSFTDAFAIPILARAFEHLRVFDEDKADFTIYIADNFSINRPLKVPIAAGDTLKSRGEIATLINQAVVSSYNHHDGSLNLINVEKNVAIHWVRNLRHMPWWVAGSPLQQIIGCWMRKQGFELTHAAAVGFPDGGVILAGKSGAGKSTTTLSCMESGLFYLSEDYCLTSIGAKAYAYSVYNSAKLEPNTLQKFPHLAKHAANQDRQHWEKALLFQHEYSPKRILTSFPLKAVLVLEITTNTDTVIRTCSQGEALLALSASTICQLSTTGQTTLKHFSILVQRIPCYKLALGSDRQLVASCVADFLQGFMV